MENNSLFPLKYRIRKTGELVKEMYFKEWDSDADFDVDDLVAIANGIIDALKEPKKGL